MDATPADSLLARHARALLVLAGALAVGVAVLWVLAKTTSLLPPADDAYHWRMLREHHGPLRDAARAVASLGDAGMAILTVAALAAVSWALEGPRAALLPFAAAAVVVPTTIAKDLPGRMTTLPSGHAAYAVAVGGYAAWLLLAARRPRLAAALFALALAMAPARVIEGAHRPPDVIAGVALGLAWLLLVLVAARRRVASQPRYP